MSNSSDRRLTSNVRPLPAWHIPTAKQLASIFDQIADAKDLLRMDAGQFTPEELRFLNENPD